MVPRMQWPIMLTSCLLIVVMGLGVTSAAGPGVPNDPADDGFLITSLPYRKNQNTQRATIDFGDPISTCINSPVGNTVWYEFTPTTTATVEVNTIGSNYDTVLTVYQTDNIE